MNLSQALNSALQLHQQRSLDQAALEYAAILEAHPKHFDALHLLGVVRSQQGHHAEALEKIKAALKLNPMSAEAWSNLGLVYGLLGRSQEALASYDRAFTIRPGDAEMLHNRGIVLRDLNRPEEALASYDEALAIEPERAQTHFNRGNVLRDLMRPNEALASYDRALAIKPDDAKALYNRANVLRGLKRLDEALASFDKALALSPGYAEALNNRGNTLRDLKRPKEALASYDKALEVRPDYAEALNNRGNALRELNRPEEALASYDKALAVKPDYAEAPNSRGCILLDLNRPEEALTSFDKALAIKPDYTEALNNRGNALRDLNRPDQALESYDEALAISPDNVEVLNNRGCILLDLNRPEEAMVNFDMALANRGDHPYAFGGIASCAIKACDWTRVESVSRELAARVRDETSIITPFVLLGYSNDASLQLSCARKYICNNKSLRQESLCGGTIGHHDKIRIAYISADFKRHPLAYLTAELFESHDRSRFEVMGISFGADDKSDFRSRLVKSFDQFVDVRMETDRDVARFLLERDIDIAVDLMGHTQNARPKILAHRPAPVQVSYLGYPGTMAADFIDYIIVDRIILPFDQQPFFTENIVHLPDCYMANDSKKMIAASVPTRQQAGLPEKGFVFCCFNNSWKITRPFFEVWMRLLHEIEGSALWLMRTNASAEANLRKAVMERGIDPARLVFADWLPLEEHLARYRLADLFLDTLPYGAHTTGSDALWAGVPLVTCFGESFAGRVGASLLTAIGLPELIAPNLTEYESLCVKMATDTSFYRSVHRELERNRLTYPLFDTKRFCRHIEAAYVKMSEIALRGERPQSFAVEKSEIE
jgi:protein O-GlcNAc transferase